MRRDVKGEFIFHSGRCIPDWSGGETGMVFLLVSTFMGETEFLQAVPEK